MTSDEEVKSVAFKRFSRLTTKFPLLLKQYRKPIAFEDFTCSRCPSVATCEWAFDPYNTDGDCLESK